MKKPLILISAMLLIFNLAATSQQFEEPKVNGEGFEKVKAYFGADFAMQYQGLDHKTSGAADLILLGKGFNLPTANFNIGADLAPGIQVSLVTYLSARHHNESWVKGGYLLMDQLPFINSPVVDKLMDYLTIKVGVMELNYGDANFRRSDNGKVVNNPFVGNYIMNAFTTAPAAEIYFRHPSGLLVTGGVAQAIVNQVISAYDKNTKEYVEYNTSDELSFYGKVGIDKNVNDDLRLRATASVFTGKNHSLQLYSGDRAGSRYYLVMNEQTAAGGGVDIKSPHLTGDYNPTAFGNILDNNSFMLNLFAEFKGFEFFALYENATGTNSNWVAPTPPAVTPAAAYVQSDYDFSHYSVEGIYRFGGEKQFWVGMRYNSITDQEDQVVNRIQGIGGWKLTKNVLAKFEYVDQEYKDFAKYNNGESGFNGFMFETAISF
jgi:hypothetical protein